MKRLDLPYPRRMLRRKYTFRLWLEKHAVVLTLDAAKYVSI